MTKFDLLLLTVGFIAFVTGSGIFTSRRGRSRLAPEGGMAPAEDEQALDRRTSHLDAQLRMASVEVSDDRGARLCSGSTPTSFRLKRVEKGSFDSIDYHIAVRTPQGHAQRVVLRAVPNGWYICGEFISSPKVGWIVFSPDRNALYYLEQSKVAAAGEDDPDPGDDNPNVSFVLLEDVSDALRAQLQRLKLS